MLFIYLFVCMCAMLGEREAVSEVVMSKLQSQSMPPHSAMVRNAGDGENGK